MDEITSSHIKEHALFLSKELELHTWMDLRTKRDMSVRYVDGYPWLCAKQQDQWIKIRNLYSSCRDEKNNYGPA